MNNALQEIRPPNRKVLRLLDLIVLPLSGIISIFTASLVLYTTPIRSFLILWVLGSIVVFMVAINYRLNIVSFPEPLLRLVRDQKAGFYVWAWVTILFVTASFYVDIIKLVGLYPQYILPYAALIVRTPRGRSLTPSVLIVTVATAAVLSFGSFMSILKYQGLWQNQSVFLELENILSISSLIIWEVFGPLVIYYLVRRSQLNQIRIRAVEEAMLRMLEIDDPIISASEVVRILKDKVGIGERILLLSYDQNTDILKVIASAGEKVIGAFGYELPLGRGISRRAIKTKQTQYVKDVTKDPDYISGGLPGNGSEISVPIIVQSDNLPRVIGTINIQDGSINAYSFEDISVVEIFAKIISNFDYGYSEEFEVQLNKSLEKIYKFDDPERLAYQVVDSASSLFESPLVCYYRLAVGTGFPLRPCYLKGNFKFPEHFVNPNITAADSNLMQWVSEWDVKFIRYMKSDFDLLTGKLGFGKEFQENEDVVSMCFLPVGSRDYKVGVLLLFFKNQKIFSKSETINIKGFTREIWTHIAKAESIKSILRGFAKPQIQFHSTMAETGLGRGTWELILGQIERSSQVSLELKSQVKQLRLGINLFLDKVRAWEATQGFQLGGTEFFSLKDSLSKACGELQQRFGGVVVREIDNKVEVENNDIKQVVYILVTEAIRNAFIHGKTVKQIFLKISYSDNHISLAISDDGVGFNPKDILIAYNNDPMYVSPGSIFDLDLLAQQFLGASPIDWLDTAPGKGTRLLWEIPIISNKR